MRLSLKGLSKKTVFIWMTGLFVGVAVTQLFVLYSSLTRRTVPLNQPDTPLVTVIKPGTGTSFVRIDQDFVKLNIVAFRADNGDILYETSADQRADYARAQLYPDYIRRSIDGANAGTKIRIQIPSSLKSSAEQLFDVTKFDDADIVLDIELISILELGV
jgi:hypothetical protein